MSIDRFHHVRDPEAFFQRVYRYFYFKGFTNIFLSGFLDLLSVFFVGFLFVFLAGAVDYDELSKHIHTRVRLISRVLCRIPLISSWQLRSARMDPQTNQACSLQIAWDTCPSPSPECDRCTRLFSL